MGILATTHPTLLDVAKRLDPNGRVATIAELLSQTNEVLDDMVFAEGNLPTGHRSTIRSGLPTPTWRKLYGGVQPTKGRTVQVTDAIGMLEDYAEVDKALADLNGNTAEFRLSEDRAHLEGLNQEIARTLFYGNETSAPEAFTGLAPRYNSASAASGANLIKGTMDGTNPTHASIWLVVWGTNTVHGVYPKGSKAGLTMEDKGQVTVEDIGGNNGGRMEAYRTHYRWDCGLVVRDWRYAVRIQFKVAGLAAARSTSSSDLVDLMTQAVDLVPSLSLGRPAFYMNRTARSVVRRQMADTVKNSTLTIDQVSGRPLMSFDGIPVRRCDVLLNTEAGI